MKVSRLVGYILSLTILGTSPLLTTITHPNPAFAEETSAVKKVVLLDLFQRLAGISLVPQGGVSSITPEVTKITLVESYALANWQWGNGRGETVLINQNEQWRVIVGSSGVLTPSTLVQYGIPRDLARKLINYDKGASEEQPPVSDLFTTILPQLQQQTDVLILLPSQFPSSKEKIYLKSDISNKNYLIRLSLTPNCLSTECDFGFLSAEPVNSVYYPRNWFTKEVTLAQGIQGYFTPKLCNASCTPSIIQWMWEDRTYRIALKGIGRDGLEEEAIMVAIANSAIEAGPR
ncbi:MAG TPA: hypothetical protein DCL61_02220 [Cyanobacteria bacterium UBA12227]|nr:hypothetical protein [Cyanobacteria bacterium UBA12227]HAX85942.1 hypothetical protein [Cyanobacteria bacterium UBA11370]HBY79968.1 hypothetical protein [Cyanobacteria bacterium UBA11148]